MAPPPSQPRLRSGCARPEMGFPSVRRFAGRSFHQLQVYPFGADLAAVEMEEIRIIVGPAAGAAPNCVALRRVELHRCRIRIQFLWLPARSIPARRAVSPVAARLRNPQHAATSRDGQRAQSSETCVRLSLDAPAVVSMQACCEIFDFIRRNGAWRNGARWAVYRRFAAPSPVPHPWVTRCAASTTGSVGMGSGDLPSQCLRDAMTGAANRIRISPAHRRNDAKQRPADVGQPTIGVSGVVTSGDCQWRADWCAVHQLSPVPTLNPAAIGHLHRATRAHLPGVFAFAVSGDGDFEPRRTSSGFNLRVTMPLQPSDVERVCAMRHQALRRLPQPRGCTTSCASSFVSCARIAHCHRNCGFQSRSARTIGCIARALLERAGRVGADSNARSGSPRAARCRWVRSCAHDALAVYGIALSGCNPEFAAVESAVLKLLDMVHFGASHRVLRRGSAGLAVPPARALSWRGRSTVVAVRIDAGGRTLARSKSGAARAVATHANARAGNPISLSLARSLRAGQLPRHYRRSRVPIGFALSCVMASIARARAFRDNVRGIDGSTGHAGDQCEKFRSAAVSAARDLTAAR